MEEVVLMILNEWLIKILPIPYWVIVTYFVFVGGLLLFLFILEWKYYGLKFDKEQRDKKQITKGE
jgi:hypothetical protein